MVQLGAIMGAATKPPGCTLKLSGKSIDAFPEMESAREPEGWRRVRLVLRKAARAHEQAMGSGELAASAYDSKRRRLLTRADHCWLDTRLRSGHSAQALNCCVRIFGGGYKACCRGTSRLMPGLY